MIISVLCCYMEQVLVLVFLLLHRLSDNRVDIDIDIEGPTCKRNPANGMIV